MKKPYIEHQRIYPLSIYLNGKFIGKYEPTSKESKINIVISSDEIEKQVKQQQTVIKEQEEQIGTLTEEKDLLEKRISELEDEAMGYI